MHCKLTAYSDKSCGVTSDLEAAAVAVVFNIAEGEAAKVKLSR